MTRAEYKADFRIFRCKVNQARAKRPVNIGSVKHISADNKIHFHASDWPNERTAKTCNPSMWRVGSTPNSPASLLDVVCSSMCRNNKYIRRRWIEVLKECEPLPLPR